MKGNTLIFAGLGALAMLFLLGLGLGSRVNEVQKPTADRFTPGQWLRILDRWSAAFAPALDLQQLEFGCQRVGRALFLDQSSPSCEVLIPSSDRPVRRGMLRLTGGNTAIKVVYTPRNEDEMQANLNVGRPVRLAVFAAGGTLDLRCGGCATGEEGRARVEFD